MRIYFGAGLNEQLSPHINEAAQGSYNFELNKDSYKFVPRKPFDLSATTSNAGDIRGFLQLVKRDDTETTLVQSGAQVLKWTSSTMSAVGSCSATSQLRADYWSLNDLLIVADLQKLTPVSKWDGTTFGSISTGLGSALYAKYVIVHKGRTWLFNVKSGSTDTPHLMVASAFENYQSYDTTNRATSATLSAGTEAFYMLTPDLREINGACLFHEDLIISTKEGRLYKLTGTNSTNYAWAEFYAQSQATGAESVVNMGNDVLYMKKGGNIESLTSTINYGDVDADDVSRWIKETVKNQINAIGVYDQQNQKVFFFLSGKVLVFFKDVYYAGALQDESGQRAKQSPWSVYLTNHASAFTTSAAKYMRIPGTTRYTVYFGDSSGHIYDLNGSGVNGDGGTATIQAVVRKRTIDGRDGVAANGRGGLRFGNHILRGTVQYRRKQACTLNIDFDWADEYSTSTVMIPLKGPPANTGLFYFGGPYYWGGPIYWGNSVFSDKISHQNFSPTGKGSAVRLTFYTDTNAPFEVDNVELK